ncbi:MAG: Ada metal-binding domain-containing protein [Chloroflexota bacterium]
MAKLYFLVGPDGEPYPSETPGEYGGYRPGKIYGRLDCRTALRAIARGGYVKHRVFFADEATAIAAGYRPCARCLPEKYRAWKATRGTDDHAENLRDLESPYLLDGEVINPGQPAGPELR